MKKEERLFSIIGELSDDMIAEAAGIKNKNKWKQWVYVAASLTLVIGMGIMLSKGNGASIESHGNLPVLTLDSEGFFSGGMGFEGLMAYDISEIVNDNPWIEGTDIDHLPVFENIYAYDEHFRIPNVNRDKMKNTLIEVAKRLDMDKKSIRKFKRDIRDEYFDISNMSIEDKAMKVSINESLTVRVSFDPSISLPGEYNFNYHAPYEDIKSVADYLADEYKALINMKNPKINIGGGDYNIHKQQSYEINFFNESGNIEDEIVNYNFNNVAFGRDDDGGLSSVSIRQTDLSHIIGNYPIITSEQAKELLVKGNYITTVPDEFPGEEYIRKIELVYRTGTNEKIYLPYYCIYVELITEGMVEGLNTYGAYYVPAVEGQYIENMPLWDGSFN